MLSVLLYILYYIRWVARQWQRMNEKDEISGVGGKL